MRRSRAMISLLLAPVAFAGRASAAPPDGASALAPLSVVDAPAPAPVPAPPLPPPGVREPPLVIALVAGVATALIPLALGTSHTATAATDPSRNAGYVVAGAGFALAPIVAHLALGEWNRAAAFGAVPVVSELGVIALVSREPDAIFHRTQLSRTAFALLFSFDVFGAAVGLVDVMFAGNRARAAAGSPRTAASSALGGITLAPSLGRDQGGLVLGGIL